MGTVYGFMARLANLIALFMGVVASCDFASCKCTWLRSERKYRQEAEIDKMLSMLFREQT